jgi:UDP-N-acetyl-D-glucosamine/UDP-N-acetyl-D-galactosamine dehydrogenase
MPNATLPVLENARVAVIGLGYVGLPLAVAFGRKFPTAGFDINTARVDELRRHRDHTLEVSPEELAAATKLSVHSDPAQLRECDIFIVTVPTPIDEFKRPDLRPLESASVTVGRAIRRGGIAIYESTVYPGATEEICVPIIERESGLKHNVDFYTGYSPERINPGDKLHRLETIVKVTAGSTPEAADVVDALYRGIVEAGTHRASSIRVAEMAKVIENTQRDLNIALVNELALICHRLGIDSREVLDAAGTKWNFLPFRPGLVGGHCIGVDPYYLTHKAQQIGYHPEVILSGRRINDGMGSHVAQRVIHQMVQRRMHVAQAKVLVLGLAFKENCPDLRNTRVTDVIAELRRYGADVDVHDPWVDVAEAQHEYGLTPVKAPAPATYDAIVLAVAHREFVALGAAGIRALGKPGCVLFDVKQVLARADCDDRL